jgi:hypothetical protein
MFFLLTMSKNADIKLKIPRIANGIQIPNKSDATPLKNKIIVPPAS